MDPRDRALFSISVAAEMSGMHPQTLRAYERRGLVRPQRTSGNTRRYSPRDIERLRLIHHLTQERGLNLAGVEMVLELTDELERARERIATLERAVAELMRRLRTDVEAVRRARRADIVPVSTHAVEVHPRYGRRRR